MGSGYRGLTIYQRSYENAKRVHGMSLMFPSHEKYEMGGQLRRAAMSIPLNIAEGYGKKDSGAELRRFLRMALGSCNELLVLLDFSRDFHYITKEQHGETARESEEIARMLSAWIQKLTTP